MLVFDPKRGKRSAQVPAGQAIMDEACTKQPGDLAQRIQNAFYQYNRQGFDSYTQ